MDAMPLIGCSGWQYREWRGGFYPAGLSQRAWFARYAEAFAAVEVNGSFYRWPVAATLVRWREAAPPGFRYVLKGNREVTHTDRLRAPERTVLPLLAALGALGDACAGVLWQLPPGLRRDDALLARFLAVLPADGTHAIEFRHPSWHCDATAARLDARVVGCVAHDFAGAEPWTVATGGVRYLRLHGWPEGRYSGGYPDERLARWADWLAQHRGAGLCCAFLNNTMSGDAPGDAMRLQAMVRERRGAA